MKSSQVTLDEKMGAIISTAYESLDNPMTEQVDYAKKILDKVIDRVNIFALLYEPDHPKQWFTDQSLYQANPLALEVEVIKNSIIEKRQEAIDMPSAMTNFKTKHLNIFVDGNELEQYISLEDLREGKIEVNSYDWKGKEVWLGIDLSKLLDTISVMV